jgi:DNA-binding MarR family transcriptional regulator
MQASEPPATKRTRSELMASAVEAIVRFQEAADALDEAAASVLGLTRSEIRCLGAVERGPLSAGELAARLHLTRGAITAMVDRLEARNMVERRPVSDDRRRVNVAMTQNARTSLLQIYGPLAADAAKHAKDYSDEQLETIGDFLQAGRELQFKHAARVRTFAPSPRNGDSE